MAAATEQFVANVVERQRGELNTWDKALDHLGALLEDARKRRRMTPNKVMSSNYVLHRSGKTIGGFDGPYTTFVSEQARKASQSLQMTRDYLRASKVPILPGRSFHVSQLSAAEKFANRLGDYVTVRPVSALAGHGTTISVAPGTDFVRAWERALDACKELRPLNQQIQVEGTKSGLTLRVYLVGEAPAGAVVRVPFYVVGDGETTVEDLIREEKSRRRQCRYLKKRFPTVDNEFLAPAGTSLEAVPEAGAIHFLTQVPNVDTGGGLSVDVLGEVNKALIDLAIDAMWAFPGLDATAVDILTPSLEDATDAVVLDVDPAADVTEFIYPAYGRPRRVSLKILDHMIARAS